MFWGVWHLLNVFIYDCSKTHRLKLEKQSGVMQKTTELS